MKCLVRAGRFFLWGLTRPTRPRRPGLPPTARPTCQGEVLIPAASPALMFRE
jgi:hypothetical protein